MIGYIKLHRQITRWEWYTDVNTKSLFLHCLLMANHKDNQWRGIEIKRGSFITSLRKLATEIGLTVSQTRTSLKKLEMTQEITQQSHTHNTLIKVLNYEQYQGYEEEKKDIDSTIIAQDIAVKSQTNRTKHRTQNSNKQELKEIKNEKNEKNIKDNLYFDVDELNEVFKDFIKMRKSLKDGAMTERAITMMINKLNKYDVEYAIKMLEQSILKNYKDVYELKNENKPKEFKTKQQHMDEQKNEQLKKWLKENTRDVIEEDV